MPTRPEDIINRALDEIGVDEIGDMFEGSRAAKAALRVYDSTLRQLFCAAHWNFARKQLQLHMLADISATYVAETDVPAPWSFMYEWPVDCVHPRFVMQLGTTSLDTAGAPNSVPGWHGAVPFIVGNVPRPNEFDTSWDTIEGHDPESTRVILTDAIGATLVYTGLMQYPDAWDPLFEQAMVAALAARLAMPLVPDKGAAMQLRRDNVAIAREALDRARVRDGNEGWTVVNHIPDWIRARTGSPDPTGAFINPWRSMDLIDSAGGIY